MIGDNLTTSMLQRALDGTWQRQKAISANIANHETPGYKARRVNFEDTLRAEIGKMGQATLQSGGLNREEKQAALDDVKTANISNGYDNSTSMRADGNNVDLDAENIELVKAQMQYMYLISSISSTYNGLRYAIKGR